MKGEYILRVNFLLPIYECEMIINPVLFFSIFLKELYIFILFIFINFICMNKFVFVIVK